MRDIDMDELKICPFCGGKAQIKVNAKTMNTQASCEKCNVVMKKSFAGDKRIKAILEQLITESWNTRYYDGSNTENM